MGNLRFWLIAKILREMRFMSISKWLEFLRPLKRHNFLLMLTFDMLFMLVFDF